MRVGALTRLRDNWRGVIVLEARGFPPSVFYSTQPHPLDAMAKGSMAIPIDTCAYAVRVRSAYTQCVYVVRVRAFKRLLEARLNDMQACNPAG
jgi:hypothetical protein